MFGVTARIGNYIGLTLKTLSGMVALQKTLSEVAIDYAKNNGLGVKAGRLAEQYTTVARAYNEIVDYHEKG